MTGGGWAADPAMADDDSSRSATADDVQDLPVDDVHDPPVEDANGSAGTDADAPAGSNRESDSSTRRFGAREVVVPLRVYKVVTVFSTLIAVVLVVAGFLALDAATRRASAPPSEVDPVLAVLGLLAIAGGGVVYAYASRFRAPGMGSPKTGEDEGGDDG